MRMWNPQIGCGISPKIREIGKGYSGAASVVLANILGDQTSFSFTSGKPFEGLTRSFTSFSQAARESADSRVYAGIHFRSACEDGLTLGRRVGERVVKLYLQPTKK